MSTIIKQLDVNTINQIAAGEVVEAPSSVVKELVENSLDAGASYIQLKIEDGGKKLIEVLDNGVGMSQEDMKICHLKHTTSKINNAFDIVKVGTFGFRGEALASISSVSKLRIQSKREIDEYGYEINVENSDIVKETICAFPDKGTKITVKDLFYNVPARLSFLEKEKSTKLTKHIVDLFQKISLAHPNVRFELQVDRVTIFRSNGDGKYRHILASIYNNELAKNMIKVDTDVYGVKVFGYISKPEFCVGNKTKQSFFVNNRYVKMDILSQAIRNGYNEYAVTKKHPVCLLFIDIDPTKVDINVHPRKIEVRFKHSIFPVITSAVQQALYQNSSYPNVQLTKDTNKAVNSSHISNYNDFNKQSIYQNNTHKQPLNENNDIKNVSKNTPKKEIVDKLISEDLYNLEEFDFNENDVESEISEISNSEQIEFEELNVDEIKFKDYENIQVIGQIHNSYIVAQHNEGMIMIDQHAAHERVLYEQYLNSFSKDDIVTVELLIPDTIELPMSDYYVVKDNLDFFKKYGFELEDFGMNTFVIRKFPSIFKDKQIKQTVITMIDELLQIENKSAVDDYINKKIIMRSCKSAIKANMALTTWEMEKLLKDLMKCDNPYHCPHGRPIIINFTTYEIEKSFNRVV